MAATEKNKQTKVKWTGLGLWNVFFIGEFLLGGFGYLSLNLLQNVLLLVFVLFPIGNRYLRWFRTLVAVVIGLLRKLAAGVGQHSRQLP